MIVVEYATEDCAVCPEPVVLDDCDGDFDGARWHYYKGSESGFRCESCMEWCHNECGDRKQRLCRPCAEDVR